MPTPELPLLTFAHAAAFEAWLEQQPPASPGVWLKFAKKGAPEVTIEKSEAIDCALAHGWIDGQLGRVDEQFFKIRFTPRRPKSAWSQYNCERVERLIAAGRMTSRGLEQVAQAKADGRWDKAYAPQAQAGVEPDLQAALDTRPEAKAFFAALDAANRFSVLYRVHQTKTPEKRAAKIADLVEMLARGEAIHPRRTPRAR